MTESEWLASTDPQAMLERITKPGDSAFPQPQRASDRKLRLFAEEAGCPTCARLYQREHISAYAYAEYVEGAACRARVEKAVILRDIFGNPFRPVELKNFEYVVGWRQKTILGIAQHIYDERRFEEMPILADALEEAGCTDEEILRHCRGWERCGRCKGLGSVRTDFHDVFGPIRKCDDMILARPGPSCGNKGWVKIESPHVRGCWAIDLLLGKE